MVNRLPTECNLLVVLGPTASGKTRLGVGLARALGGEIISADSRQVFRGMDIGTGKDLAEYGEIPCHLIDIADPGAEFSVFEFVRRFRQTFTAICERQKLPVLVGGTGLYLDAVLRGYRMVEAPENLPLRSGLAVLSLDELQERLRSVNPSLHNTTDLVDRDRIIRALEIAVHEAESAAEPPEELNLNPLVFGIRWERSVLRQRITARLRERMASGMVEEVERLLADGIPPAVLENYGLEYRYLSYYLSGSLNRNDMFQKLNSAIHDFAKRQETWFRRMERHGVRIQWLEGAGDPLRQALTLLEGECRR